MTPTCEVHVPFAKPGIDEWEIRRKERGRQDVKVCPSCEALELKGSALGGLVSHGAHGGDTLSLPSSCHESPHISR